jgi:hypothetical protein
MSRERQEVDGSISLCWNRIENIRLFAGGPYRDHPFVATNFF